MSDRTYLAIRCSAKLNILAEHISNPKNASILFSKEQKEAVYWVATKQSLSN